MLDGFETARDARSAMKWQLAAALSGFAHLAAGWLATPATDAQSMATTDTQYLAFQVFTASPNPHIAFGDTAELGEPPASAELDAFAAA